MAYLFQDTARAARRLQVLAGVFAPSSRAFMQDRVRRTLFLSERSRNNEYLATCRGKGLRPYYPDHR
jgi:hypothetical protein